MWLFPSLTGALLDELRVVGYLQAAGHTKLMSTLKHYAKWIPSEDRRYVDMLDKSLEKLGTSPWHKVDTSEKEETEVVETLVGRVGVEPTAR